MADQRYCITEGRDTIEMAVPPVPGPALYSGQPQIIVVQEAPAPRRYENYASTTSKAFGITQIVLGLLAIIINIVAIVLESEGDHGDNYVAMSFFGCGIWSGVWFLITGPFGLMASSGKTQYSIIAFMVLSIISVLVFNLAFFALAVIGTLLSSELARIMMGLLLIISLLEFVIAIWSSVICCQAVCCGSRQAFVAPVYNGQYVQPGGGGQVVYLQTGAPQGGQPALVLNKGNTQYQQLQMYNQPQAQKSAAPQACQPGFNATLGSPNHTSQPGTGECEPPPQYSSTAPTAEQKN